MVSWLVAEGYARTRGEGSAICLRLVQSKRISAVGALGNEPRQSTFRDADGAFYRFAEDEPSRGGLLESVTFKVPVQKKKVFPGRLSAVPEEDDVDDPETAIDVDDDHVEQIYPPQQQRSELWEFAPHTAHNSLALDVALAEDVVQACRAWKDGEDSSDEILRSKLRELRRNVRRVLGKDALGWTKARTSASGAVVSRRSREPRGGFYTVRTDGVVNGTTPAQFQRDFLDPSRRRRWEPTFAASVVVDDDLMPPDDPEKSDDVSSSSEQKESPASSTAPQNSATTTKPPVAASLGAQEKPSSSSISMNYDAVERVEIADWAAVDLSGKPEGLAVAVAVADPKILKEATANAKTTSVCEVCSAQLMAGDKEDSLDAAPCPTCARIACLHCRGRLAWRVDAKVVVRVCRPCYVDHPNIYHPALEHSSISDQLQSWWNMAAVKRDLETKGLDSTKVANLLNDDIDDIKQEDLTGDDFLPVPGDDDDRLLDDAPDAECLDDADDGGTPASSIQRDESGASSASKKGTDSTSSMSASGQAPVVVVIPVIPQVSEDLTTTATTRSVPPEEDKAVVSPTTPTKPLLKWSKCTRCGARVARTMEAMEYHSDFECVGSIEENDEETSGSTTLGGVDKRESTRRCRNRWPRIIYRTAKLPRSALFRPREVCSFQDTFGDEDVVTEEETKRGFSTEADGSQVAVVNGTRYCYEISVRHGGVLGEKNHVTVEVLLLGHAARPVGATSCELTVVSQVDAGRNSRAPHWMVALVHGEDARFGALAAFESPAAAAAREMKLIDDDKKDDDNKKSSKRPTLEGVLEEEEEVVASEEEVSPTTTTHPGDAVSMSVSDFELVAVLGRGGFGTVMQVRKKANGKVYAMKVFKKAELRRRRQVERTRTERGIIQHADHPYIVKLRYAFQNASKLYMVMDFAQGGDFFSFLRRFRRLDEAWARIYLAEIALALQHLHDMNVVYRDLKPENVLMDADGHALLADFGLARDFSAREPLPRDRVALFTEGGRSSSATLGGTLAASRSYCGTERYMAPEMLLQRGHTRAVDWWGLGLLAHEMMASRHPFQGATDAETLRNMVRVDPDVDRHLSNVADALIRRLLVKRPDDRLGTQRGVLDVAAHPFFVNHNLDWDKLARRELPAPYLPPVADDVDVSFFDDEFTNETPRDSDLFDPNKNLGGFFSSPRLGGGNTPGLMKKSRGKPGQNSNTNGNFIFDLFTLQPFSGNPPSPPKKTLPPPPPGPPASGATGKKPGPKSKDEEFANFSYIEPTPAVDEPPSPTTPISGGSGTAAVVPATTS